MQPLWLDEREIRRRIDMPRAIAAMRSAFIQLSDGRAEVPVRTAVQGGGTTGLFMPGYLPGEDALGAKIVSVTPANAQAGRPVVQAIVLLLDAETGEPAALMDGTWLTALRTGAASGLATDLLANPDASVLAVVGAGGQARAQIEAVLAVRPVDDVRIRSRTMASAERLATELAREGLTNHAGGPVRFTAEGDPAAQLAGAHILVTATDAKVPVVPKDVPAGLHINAVGAYLREMQEIPASLVSGARVFVDQRKAAMEEAGDLIQAVAAGVFSWNDVAGEMGELAAGAVPGRELREEITLFKSVGSAAQDLAVARAVLDG